MAITCYNHGHNSLLATHKLGYKPHICRYIYIYIYIYILFLNNNIIYTVYIYIPLRTPSNKLSLINYITEIGGPNHHQLHACYAHIPNGLQSSFPKKTKFVQLYLIFRLIHFELQSVEEVGG